MENIAKHAGKKLSDGIDQIKDNLDALRKKGAQYAHESLPEVEEVIEKAGELGGNFMDKTVRYIKKNPGTALGYAAFTGLIIGVLLAPDRD